MRVAVISGLLGEGAERMYALGVSDMVQATPPDLELADALVNAESNLRNAVRSFLNGLTTATYNTNNPCAQLCRIKKCTKISYISYYPTGTSSRPCID